MFKKTADLVEDGSPKIDVVRLIHEERRLAVVEISSVCMRIGLMLLGFRYLVFTGYMGLSIIRL